METKDDMMQELIDKDNNGILKLLPLPLKEALTGIIYESYKRGYITALKEIAEDMQQKIKNG